MKSAREQLAEDIRTTIEEAGGFIDEDSYERIDDLVERVLDEGSSRSYPFPLPGTP